MENYRSTVVLIEGLGREPWASFFVGMAPGPSNRWFHLRHRFMPLATILDVSTVHGRVPGACTVLYLSLVAMDTDT